MQPAFLPDLTTWFARNSERMTLPREVAGLDLPEICSVLGTPVWQPARGWRRGTGSVTVEEIREGDGRVVRYETGDGAEFVARWETGPDGDLWQTEYPVKSEADLRLAEELAAQETIEVDGPTIELAVAAANASGDTANAASAAGVLAIELPRRPFSRLLLEMIGFGDGFFILMDAEERIRQIVARAEESYRAGIARIAEAVAAANSSHALGADADGPAFSSAYSPDNLDASFLTPDYFRDYLMAGYASSASLLREAGLRLTVHVGGPVGPLLGLMTEAGIECVAGVCGPPQGDATLLEARAEVGPQVILWGGIPQDALLASTPEDDFNAALEQAISDTDDRTIVGIADHVPEDALWSRIRECAAAFTDRENP